MANTWPTADNFPQKPLIAGNTEGLADTVLRTEMDCGPAKTRQRCTAGSKPNAYQFHMTGTNVAALVTFYETTLSGGADSFEWDHPRTAVTGDWRILAPPQWTQIKNGLYLVTIEFEELP